PVPWNNCGPGWIDFTATKKSLCNLRRDLDNFGREEPVRLAMHGSRCFRARRAAETENLAVALVEPVLVVLDAILRLRLHIGKMRVRHGLGGRSVNFMDVHIRRHPGP